MCATFWTDVSSSGRNTCPMGLPNPAVGTFGTSDGDPGSGSPSCFSGESSATRRSHDGTPVCLESYRAFAGPGQISSRTLCTKRS